MGERRLGRPFLDDVSRPGFDGDLEARMLSWQKGILRAMARPKKYPEELIERGVRLALESERPIAHVAHDLGMHPETLRKKVRQAEADSGARPELLELAGARGDPAVAPGELRAAPRERDPEVSERVFRQGARPRPTEVSRYIDEHRGRFGVEPICRTLGVSASAYYQRATGRRSRRAVEDERLLGADPRAARGQLLRLRIPADVEGAAAAPASRSRAARWSG